MEVHKNVRLKRLRRIHSLSLLFSVDFVWMIKLNVRPTHYLYFGRVWREQTGIGPMNRSLLDANKVSQCIHSFTYLQVSVYCVLWNEFFLS